MLVNLLPGLRELRAPLVSGYLWLTLFFLAFHDDLPSKSDPGTVLRPVFDLGSELSTVGFAAVAGVAAYLVGSAVQELWKQLGRLASPQRPLYGEAGARTSATGRRDVHDAVRIRVQAIKRELYQVALSPGEKGIDAEPTAETVERELPLIRTLLLGERPELVGELDRIQAEADLRVTVAFPLAFLAVFLAIELSTWGWLLILIPAALLLLQGYQRYLAAGDLLAKALRVGKANAPALEALATSAKAVLERVELEGKLRRGLDDGDGLAAFRLGNLQASWDDFEAAVLSFKVATGKGVVRAYAELGLVHERRGDAEQAERAYRDGDERGDAKASALLAVLLEKLERSEEAREPAKRAEELAEGTDSEAPAVPSPRDSSAAAYRSRARSGDAKAAINLGLLLAREGNHEGAIEAFEEATELDPSDARAWSQLGFAWSERREPVKARDAYQRSLELREEQLGPDHLDVALTLGNLGITLSVLGELEEARRLEERALAIREAQLGPDSPGVATILRNLAATLRDLGELDEALKSSRRALEITERELGPDHLEVAILLEMEGAVLRILGEFEQARQRFERALAIKEAELGDSHLDLAASLVNLGISVRELGERERARQLQERALEIERAELGDDHLEVAASVASLGNTLYESQEYEKARRLQEEALETEERHLGASHFTVAQTLDSLAQTWRATGDLERALPAFDRAVEIFETRPYRPDLAIGLRGQAETLRALGRTVEAREAIARAMRLQTEMFGQSHPELAKTLDATADILDDLGVVEGAAEARERAARIRRERGL